ncbi:MULTISPECIES: hypothetical protein [unclassified Micromonospora]|uniref:hypothetical protein n=1 Tax=unclassified Micromonospora TaxID=2617518 RepID=UPI001C216A51|nr:MULTISPECIES: hypothetical protein [unclassified Micromonospora]MBU8858589.1 hypothetical protein [Micromonospora sp. WMMB482]MDM4784232.1 hypothetical protein [Micromonospora sp. b486]
MDSPVVAVLLGIMAVVVIFLAVGLGVAVLTGTPLRPPDLRRPEDRDGRETRDR